MAPPLPPVPPEPALALTPALLVPPTPPFPPELTASIAAELAPTVMVPPLTGTSCFESVPTLWTDPPSRLMTTWPPLPPLPPFPPLPFHSSELP